MRIIVASVQSPTPVVDGASLRLFHLLEELRGRHEIHVVCYGTGVELEGVTSTTLQAPPRPSVTTRIARAARSVRSEPALVQEGRSGGLPAAVAGARARRSFDVAHVSGAPSAFLGEALEGVPRLYDAIDAWHVSRAEEARADGFPRSVLRRAASLSIPQFERSALARCQVTTVTSAADRDALLGLSPSARVEVVPNGVDAEYFAPQTGIEADPALIAFHGNFGYPPNADAARFLARDVLPRAAARVPGAHLRLIGRNPPHDVQALAAQDVEVTGAVPDVRPLLAEAAVVACTLRTGTGIKNKLLEAAALGLPIVATTAALGDVELVDEQHLLVRDDADSIAIAITELLSNPARGAELGAAARSAVVGRWTWQQAASTFERLYGEIRERRG
jgi:glycosyltransferase involved in cell wall biosynthesis